MGLKSVFPVFCDTWLSDIGGLGCMVKMVICRGSTYDRM